MKLNLSYPSTKPISKGRLGLGDGVGGVDLLSPLPVWPTFYTTPDKNPQLMRTSEL